ncbi:ArgE/DapE family deacylase [Pseudomonas sp. ES3-33]|uniref:ArgE/DapE family deacylase n=1 Tax=Pseudomonas sp. ES3-33 TaxID=1628833 RepID=UPI0005D3AA0E|nr:ArgE/DapE family deacylase [Pseudomonas sp. ES3-33]KJH76726.1 acetylornithine deacetylase [Pseudomonas sp. ES3-33]
MKKISISALEKDIVAAVETLRDDSIALLSELVSHASLLGEEQSAQSVMERVFADELKLEVQALTIDESQIKDHPGYSPSLVSYDGRVNVIGTHRPSVVQGKSIIFNGHIDVVPVGDERLWTRPPFQPWVDGDKLIGRGASDMKAGIVSYIMAFKALKRLGYEPAAKVILQSVIEEECTGNGALACLVAGHTADAAIITEPTAGLMTCQMGVLWLSVEISGKPAHAAQATQGSSAVDFALAMFAGLKTLESEWNEPANRHHCYNHHPKPINFNLGKIQGGEWTSSVPSMCRLDIRIGFYPEKTVEQIKAEVEARLEALFLAHPAHLSAQYHVTYGGFQAQGCEIDMNQPVITSLQKTYADVIGEAVPLVTFEGATDARFFNLYGGIPATCYGPVGGSIHGIDEWVSIDSMMDVTKVLAVFIARWCGLNPAQ